MDDPAEHSDASLTPEQTPTRREVKYRHSQEFLPLLERLRASLLISTYQAGKLASVGVHDSQLSINLHNFEQPMGIAVHPRQIAVGSRGAVWFLQSAPQIARRLEPRDRYDACYLARKAMVTGNIHVHEMAWAGDELWVVNTRFSCLCTLSEEFSFVPRWQPAFVTALEATDRCHLNGLALEQGKPRYVTAMAESDSAAGWRPTKAHSGCVIDVTSREVVARGFAMPHSPRVHGGRLWVLNSGYGSLEVVETQSGQRNVVALMPGYTRGLAFCGDYAFIGLSRIRESAVFGGVPIAEHRDQLRCGVAVVDLRSGNSLAYLEFQTGVDEIFDVQVIDSARCVSLTGPFPSHDDASDIWIVPQPTAPGEGHL